MEEQKNGLNPKEKRTLMIVSLAIVLALVFGISYAYFLAQDESGTQTITTQDLGLVLDDGQNKQPVVLATGIKPIDREEIQTKAVKKNFTVENTGSEKLFVEITLDDIVLGTDNALQRYDFLWALYEVNGETEKNISIGSFQDTKDTVTVGKYEVLDADETKEYNLYIWIEETNRNQNVMMGQTFTAKVVATEEVYWETPASEFTFDSATGTITAYTGNGGEVSIPRVIDDVAVTKIGNYAFCVKGDNWWCESGKGITNVIIPNSVTEIGESAFGSNELTNLVIPNSVTTFRNGAFCYNENLTNIILSDSVTNIGAYSFEKMVYETGIISVTIPNSVTNIGSSAFFGHKITSIIIPNSVTTISENAFGTNPVEEIIVQGKPNMYYFADPTGLIGGLVPLEEYVTFNP